MSRTSRRNLERELPVVLVPIENRASLARRSLNNLIQALPGPQGWGRNASRTSMQGTRAVGLLMPASHSHRTRGVNMEVTKSKPKKCENLDVADLDAEKQIVFEQGDLYAQGFPVFEEIRRQGKLCDVTLKVQTSFSLTPLLIICFCFDR